jgi:hypothetical protein
MDRWTDGWTAVRRSRLRLGLGVMCGLWAEAPARGGEAMVACQVQKLLAADPAANAWLGRRVSLDGDVAAVSAFKDGEGGADAGAVYVFARGTGGPVWRETNKLIASDAAAGDQFGFSAAIRGARLIVGANQEDEAGSNAGAAYVFERDGRGMWSEVAKLTAADGAADDRFGTSVSIDADIAVVGAYQDDEHGSNSGSAYLFERGPEGDWLLLRKLSSSDAAAEDKFGFAVAVDGPTIVVGAYQKADRGPFTGAAYVFHRDQGGPGAWGEVAKLSAADAAADQLFGVVVDVDGDTAIVGANGSASGAAYIFERDAGGPGAWGQVRKLLASDAAPNDQFGSGVAISGGLAAAGSPLDDDAGSGSGSAYVYARDAGGPDQWGEVAKVVAADAALGNFFGNDVALDGMTLLAGAHRNDEAADNAGAAYVFALGGPDCNRNGLPDACDIGSGRSADRDADGVPDECSPPCPDVDGSGAVDVLDLVAVLLAWGTGDRGADVNADGTVDVADLIAVLLGWGGCR